MPPPAWDPEATALDVHPPRAADEEGAAGWEGEEEEVWLLVVPPGVDPASWVGLPLDLRGGGTIGGAARLADVSADWRGAAAVTATAGARGDGSLTAARLGGGRAGRGGRVLAATAVGGDADRPAYHRPAAVAAATIPAAVYPAQVTGLRGAFVPVGGVGGGAPLPSSLFVSAGA